MTNKPFRERTRCTGAPRRAWMSVGQLLDDKRYQTVIDTLLPLVETLHPREEIMNASVHEDLALAYQELGQYQLAANHIGKAISWCKLPGQSPVKGQLEERLADLIAEHDDVTPPKEYKPPQY